LSASYFSSGFGSVTRAPGVGGRQEQVFGGNVLVLQVLGLAAGTLEQAA